MAKRPLRPQRRNLRGRRNSPPGGGRGGKGSCGKGRLYNRQGPNKKGNQTKQQYSRR